MKQKARCFRNSPKTLEEQQDYRNSISKEILIDEVDYMATNRHNRRKYTKLKRTKVATNWFKGG